MIPERMMELWSAAPQITKEDVERLKLFRPKMSELTASVLVALHYMKYWKAIV